MVNLTGSGTTLEKTSGQACWWWSCPRSFLACLLQHEGRLSGTHKLECYCWKDKLCQLYDERRNQIVHNPEEASRQKDPGEPVTSAGWQQGWSRVHTITLPLASMKWNQLPILSWVAVSDLGRKTNHQNGMWMKLMMDIKDERDTFGAVAHSRRGKAAQPTPFTVHSVHLCSERTGSYLFFFWLQKISHILSL